MKKELPLIQKTYDFIKWFIPILNRLPRDHKFPLGERIITQLYHFLEELIKAKYAKEKIMLLEHINVKLEILRYQIRLLHDFNLISLDRYEYIAKQLLEIGSELGGWIKQQRNK